MAAGNETTRNAIAHGLVALTEHPEQKERWLADIDGMAPTAVEEIIRWASPVIHFRRTVTQDGATLGGQEFVQGDKVVLWYWSATDEAVFHRPPHLRHRPHAQRAHRLRRSGPALAWALTWPGAR